MCLSGFGLLLAGDRFQGIENPVTYPLRRKTDRYARRNPFALTETSPHTSASRRYDERIAAFSGKHRDVYRRWSLIANLRLVVVVVIAVVVWQWWQNRDAGLLLLAGVMLVGLIALIVLHGRLRTRRDALQRMITVNQRALDRLAHRWDGAPMPPDPEIGRDHPYGWDLNVVGRASLAQRIGTPATRYGWDALYTALLNPEPERDLPDRQEAVAELAAEVDLQQEVEAAGLREDEALPDPGALVRWAAEAAWLRPRAWLRVISWLSPLAVIALVVLWFADVVAAPLFVFPVAINGIIFTIWGQQAAQRVQAIVPLRDAIAGYRDMFRLISRMEPRARLLTEIDSTLEGGEHGALARSASLARIVSLAIPPGAIIYFPLQLALLWDIHVLELLEAWQAKVGGRVRTWLQAIGEWEALAALAVLRRDHPDWAFPRVDANASSLTATKLAHPLLPVDEAVANAVTVGPKGHFLFVTGSNMSGKSTLLRAIGANAVLAQAGAPVCAEALSMPSLRIWTLMRVEDSLERGVSFFMAELQRLKTVVDGVAADPSRMSLYLLDEILQGTNTGERQVASRRVLEALTRQRAIGAISSHDLELIEGTSLEDAAEQVHFAEVFTRGPSGPSMTFDYQLRLGPATSSNALALMELLGFDLGEAKVE
jgi:ABC-type multidrug transport system fused ATPase/permease subunit